MTLILQTIMLKIGLTKMEPALSLFKKADVDADYYPCLVQADSLLCLHETRIPEQSFVILCSTVPLRIGCFYAGATGCFSSSIRTLRLCEIVIACSEWEVDW